MSGTTVPFFAALMSKWFEKRRGLAVSLGLTGSCAGQFVLVPLFTRMVLRFGWRRSHFYFGVLSTPTSTLPEIHPFRKIHHFFPENSILDRYALPDRSIS